MSDRYVTLLGAEEAQRAARDLSSAAESAARSAAAIAEAVFKLQQMADGGYGGNICKLVELLEDGRIERLIYMLENKGGAK